MCAKDLKDTAAMWLEELNISGDTMVAMNHNLEDVPKEQQGSYNLFDLLDLFVDHVREGEELKQNADKALSLSDVSQQRELLKNFLDWSDGRWLSTPRTEQYDEMFDEFFNCG